MRSLSDVKELENTIDHGVPSMFVKRITAFDPLAALLPV